MTTKTYFAKVSWDKNEIMRQHENIMFETRLSADYCKIIKDAKESACRKYEADANFTIDFMIEVPEE